MEECFRKISEGVTFNQAPDDNGRLQPPANPLFRELVPGTFVLVPIPALNVEVAVLSAGVPAFGTKAPSVLWDAAQG